MDEFGCRFLEVAVKRIQNDYNFFNNGTLWHKHADFFLCLIMSSGNMSYQIEVP